MKAYFPAKGNFTGIFHSLEKIYGEDYINTGVISASASSSQEDQNVTSIFLSKSRSSPRVNWATESVENSWLEIKTKFPIILEAFEISSYNFNYWRNWNVSASNDNIEWTTLKEFTGNTVMNQNEIPFVYFVNETRHFRFFQFKMTGPTSRTDAKKYHLALQSIEFYGKWYSEYSKFHRKKSVRMNFCLFLVFLNVEK